MKKVICIVLILMQFLLMFPAAHAADLTLPVKMERQLQNDGNGLKGSFTISGNADEEHFPFLSVVQNAEYSILRNMVQEQWHFVVFQLNEAEEQINRTELYQSGDGLYLRSDFTGSTVWILPDLAGLIASRLGEGQGNPSFASAASMLMTLNDREKDNWAAVLEPYKKALELWISGYSTDPTIQRQEDGSIPSMNLNYRIPIADVKAEILALIETATKDPNLMSLLTQGMTTEESAVYLNPNLIYYYAEALNSLQLSGELVFSKSVSAMGETLSTLITLPLDPALTGYSQLSVLSEGGMTTWTVTGDDHMWLLSVPDKPEEATADSNYEFQCFAASVYSAEDKKDENFSLRISVSRAQENYADEESGKAHEIQRYTIHAQADPDILPETVPENLIPAFEPVEASVELHYSGKSGPNSPTTLEIDAVISRGEVSMALTGKVKTAATWPFVPFDPSGAVPLELSEAEMIPSALRDAWLKNAAQKIRRIQTADTTEGGDAE